MEVEELWHVWGKTAGDVSNPIVIMLNDLLDLLVLVLTRGGHTCQYPESRTTGGRL